MNQSDCRYFALDLMRFHGLLEANPYRLEFAEWRAKYGQCSYSERTITLSSFFVANNKWEDIRDTVLHEIAHALTPNQGHSEVWRAKAISIGCSGLRCGSEKIASKAWTGFCPFASRDASGNIVQVCKTVIHRHRMKSNLICKKHRTRIEWKLNKEAILEGIGISE